MLNIFIYLQNTYSGMNFKQKRLLSFLVVLSNIFFGGVEMVLVLPTLWQYLQSLGVKKEQWLGLVISAYSFSAAIGGLICGRLSDKYHNHAKMIVLICITFRVLGNFQYTLGLNVWNIFFARFLCGMGNAAGPALLAEVCRTTHLKERTTFLSICSATYQIGVIFGPAIQYVLSLIRFALFGFKLHALNVSGFFLTGLWLFHWFTILLFYRNLTEEFKSFENHKREDVRLKDFHRISEEEEIKYNNNNNNCKHNNKLQSVTNTYLNDFLTDSFVLLMFMVFTLLFCQVALETVITVVTEKFFGFSVRENTLIYMSGAVEALVSFVGIALIGPRVRDTTLQIFGWNLMVAALIWLLVVMPDFEEGNMVHMVYFLLGLFVLFLGIPIMSMATVAFSTKILSSETQGLGEGIRRVLTCLGVILGSNWAGATVQVPHIFLGLVVVMLIINGALFAGSYKSLRKHEKNLSESAIAADI